MPQEKSCISRVFGLLVFLAIIAVGIWLSIFYFGDRSQLPASLPELPADPLSYLPDLELFHKENPFNETKPGEANKWDDACCGLELTIINALDDVWYTYFDIAVSEWENGTPDALTLTTQQATQPDSECSAETGVMKVCNGDYGETDWKGINTVLLDGRYITASSARMNDHFFTSSTSDNDKRQYTMCHEIGHGFGLPHTDESFWNRDLGNCLDYTNNFNGNKSPDTSLYIYLEDLYGNVTDTTATSRTTGGRQMSDGGPKEHRHLFSSIKSESRRRDLLDSWNEIDSLVISGFVGSERDGWRLLHRTAFGEAHEIDLGDNYKIQIHLLLA